jgi:predicted oxidoreductase
MSRITFSPIIAGCMNWGAWGVRFDPKGYVRMIEQCIEAGVTTFDHADIYGNYTTEAEFGAALRTSPSIRNQIQLITKCGICLVSPNRPSHQIKHYNTSREHIVKSAEQSLMNFQTDHLDMFLIHRPDPLLDPQEVAEAFSMLKQSGKVLHFGVSNFTASQTTLLHNYHTIESTQVEISVLHTEVIHNGLLNLCISKGISVQAWSPLAGGKLHSDPDDERYRRILAVADILSEKYQANVDEILLAWLMQLPSGIAPVVGTTRHERILSAVKARGIRMTREEWFMLMRASSGREVA